MPSKPGTAAGRPAAQLGIGTAAFSAGYSLGGDAPSRSACAGLLREAIRSGVRYIDTAPAYGQAESIIGDVADLIEPENVRICTKVARDLPDSAAIRASVAASLGRLRLPRVDTVMVHNADGGTARRGDLVKGLHALVEAGLAAKCGASTYGAEDAAHVSRESWCKAIQVEHSVLNPSVVQELAHRADAVEIVARSVLCKGLLTSRRRAASQISSEIAETLDGLDRLSAEWEWPITELAIRFALDTPGVGVVLVGVTSDAELETAFRALRRPPLTAQQRQQIARFSRADSDAAHPERWSLLAGSGAG